MKRHNFRVALLSLIAPLAFAAPQFPSSTQALAETASSNSQQDRLTETVPDSCPVTKPPTPPFAPPSPYPTEFMSGSLWFGTTKLWTVLTADGRDGLSQKRFWWREGYDWRKDPHPKLTVSGKRLGSPAAPVILDDEASSGWHGDRNHAFIVDAFEVPEPGCWKMTARYEDGELSFVVWVTQ